jgi:hypothetical protein
VTRASLGRAGTLTIVLTLLVLQLVFSVWTLPLAELLTPTPLLYGDAAYHWYQITLAENLWKSHSLVGYDPFFDAGYVGGITANGSARVAALLAIVFEPWIDAVVAYKLFTFAAILLGPVCVPLAARWFGLDRRATWIASILGLLLWWVSMFRWFHTAGMNAFVLLSFVALAWVAAFWRCLREDCSALRLVVVGLAGGLATFCHPHFLIGVILGLSGLLIWHMTSLNWRRAVRTGVIVGAVAAVVTLAWFVPFWRAAGGLAPAQTLDMYQRIVDPMLIVREALGIWDGRAQGAKIYTLLWLLTVWAWFRVRTPESSGLVRGLAISAVLTALFAFLAAKIELLATIQPNRFAPVAYLFLLVPATLGALDLVSALRARLKLAYVAAIPIVLVGLFVAYELGRELSPPEHGRYGKVWPEVTGEGPYTETLLRWLNEHTNNDGRVLFETSLGRIYDGARISGYLAYKSGRELIGGPYPYRHFASFWDDKLFTRPTTEYSPQTLQPYLEKYNVGWAIVHSKSAKGLIAQLPGARKIDSFRELELFDLGRSSGFFAVGSGKVVGRDHNRVEFADVSGDRVVLRYHYIEGVEIEPRAELRKAPLDNDDKTPFIEIVRPPPRFTLRFR